MTISYSDLVRLYVEDDAGNPFPEPDPTRWAIGYSSHDNCVATTTLPPQIDGEDPVLVQTVFTGFSPDPAAFPPLLYETLAFQGTRLVDRILSDNRAAAQDAHDELVESLTSLQ